MDLSPERQAALMKWERDSIFRKKGVAVSWAVSYLLILLIPIAGGFVSSSYTSRVIRQEIQNANQLILSSLQDRIDELMEDEKSALSFLYTNSQLNAFTAIEEGDPYFYYEARELLKLLSAYQISNPGLDILIYYPKRDYVLSPRTANFSRYAYNGKFFYLDDPPSYGEWMEKLSAQYHNEFLIAPDLSLLHEGNCLVFAATARHNLAEPVNIFISIPLSRIAGLTGHLSEEFLLLTDENGQTAAVFSAEGEMERQNWPAGENLSMISVTAPSAQSRWQFTVSTPESAFWRQARQSTMLNIICQVVSLLLGIFSAMLLLRRNYRPVSRIVALLGGEKREQNEFEQFHQAYQLLSDENHTIRSTLEEQNGLLLESYLLSLLKGRRPHVSESDANSFFELNLRGNQFGLAAVQLALSGEPQQDEHAFLLLHTTFSGQMQSSRFYKTEDGPFLYYLFPLGGDATAWKRECLAALHRTRALCGEQNLSFQAVVSCAEQPHTLYLDTMEALEYASIVGAGGIMDSEEIKECEEHFRVEAEELRRALSDAVNRGDAEAAQELMEALCSLYCRQNLPFSVVRLQMTGVLNLLVEIFYPLAEEDSQRLGLLARVEHLMSDTNETSFWRELRQLAVYVCHAVRQRDRKEEAALSRQVQAYIRRHYAEDSLNISSIAAALNRSPKYLSRLFKEETGQGILDYIGCVRVEKAKKILDERSVSCEELAGMVGFTNSRTLRRVFFKVTGMTPGRYSHNLSDQEKDDPSAPEEKPPL